MERRAGSTSMCGTPLPPRAHNRMRTLIPRRRRGKSAKVANFGMQGFKKQKQLEKQLSKVEQSAVNQAGQSTAAATNPSHLGDVG